MSKASIILLFVAACVAPSQDTAQLANEQPACPPAGEECPAGWYPSWVPVNGCDCVKQDWPPTSDGSRAVAAQCPIADGVYQVSWDHARDQLRPSFAVTKELVIAGDTMNLNYTTSTGQRTLDYDYPIIWVDGGLAYIDGGNWTISFEIQGDCPSGLHGQYVVNLPYQNPDGQIQTYNLIAVPK